MLIELTPSCITSCLILLALADEHLHPARRLDQQGALHMSEDRQASDAQAHEAIADACAAALRRALALLQSSSPDQQLAEAGQQSTSIVAQYAGESGEHAQLARLVGVVERAAEHAMRAEQCHRAAAVRVDAALYELEQLRADLIGIIAPEKLAGLLRQAVAITAGQAGSERSAA